MCIRDSSYHGVNRNGNVGTLLYVHGNPEGAYQDSIGCMTIADLTEQFIQAQISFDDALQMVQERKIVYAPDATMQAMLSDRQGRTLIAVSYTHLDVYKRQSMTPSTRCALGGT